MQKMPFIPTLPKISQKLSQFTTYGALILSLMTGLLLAGCAANGGKFVALSAPENQAVVYVLRPVYQEHFLSYPYVYINGEKQQKLLNRGFLEYKLPPGQHTFTIEGDVDMGDWSAQPAELSLNLEVGKHYFLKMVPDKGRDEVTFIEISKNDALKDLGSLRESKLSPF